MLIAQPLFLLLFVPKRLPFGWRTPLRYLIAVLPQAAGVFCIVFNVAPVVGFMFGTCLLVIAFIEDITGEFRALGANAEMAKNYMATKKRFCHILQLYSEVKQLSHPKMMFDYLLNENQIDQIIAMLCSCFWYRFTDQFNVIYELIVFVFIAWCLVTICCDFLLLQSELVEYRSALYEFIRIFFGIH